MDDLLARSAALADVWLDSLKQTVQFAPGAVASRYRELKSKLETVALMQDRGRKAKTPEDVNKLVKNRFADYRTAKPEVLLARWWELARVYPLVQKVMPAETKPSPGKAIPQRDYEDRCRHYAQVLTARSQMGMAGNFVSRSVNRLVNRGYDDQNIDLKIASFLESLADWMAEQPQPAAAPTSDADPLRWLLEEKTFEANGFWPVPILATVARPPSRSSRLTPMPKDPALIQASSSDLVPLLIALATEFLESQELRGMELWEKLFKMALAYSETDKCTLTARVASHFEGCRRMAASTPRSAGYWQGLLGTTAEVSRMGDQLIPPVKDDGVLDWDAVTDRDVLEEEGEVCRLEFGDRTANRPARVYLVNDSDNRTQVSQWEKAGHLANDDLLAQSRIVRMKLWKGEAIPSLADWVHGRVKQSDGADWFHDLVVGSRGDAKGQRLLEDLLKDLSLETYPRRNERDEVLTEVLPRESITRRPASLQSDASSGQAPVTVQRFAWEAKDCRVTVQEPFDPRFQGVRDVLSRNPGSVPPKLVKLLEDLYGQITRDADRATVEGTLTSFLTDWKTATKDFSLSPDAEMPLLSAIQSVLGRLEPKWSLLPPVGVKGPAWKSEDEADVEYGFHPAVPSRELIQVESFGLRRASETLQRPCVVVSAGPEPAEYRDVLARMPRIEQEFDIKTAELFRSLPEQIATTSHEALCHDLLLRLWPLVDRSKADRLNRDADITWVRNWFESRIVGRVSPEIARRFRINRVHPNDSLVDRNWVANTDYQEYGGPRGGLSVDVVVRPQLSFVTEGDRRSPVKEKAVLYVKE